MREDDLLRWKGGVDEPRRRRHTNAGGGIQWTAAEILFLLAWALFLTALVAFTILRDS